MYLIDPLIPDAMKQNTLLFNRARIVLGAGFFMLVIAVVMGFRQLTMGLTGSAVIIFICGGMMPLMVPVLKRTQSVLITGNTITAILFGLMTYLIIRFGGVVSTVAPWYMAVVVLGVIMAGFRSGVVWGSIAVSVFTTIFIAQVNGWDLPMAAIELTGTFINYLVLLITMVFLGLIYEKTSHSSQQQLEVEKGQSQAMTQELSRVIDEIDQVMRGVEEHDLSRTVSGHYDGKLDELKQTINRSLGVLNELLIRFQSASRLINGGSQQVQVSAQSIAAGVSQQASSLEEISAAMETVGSQSQANDESSDQVRQLTAKALQEVDLGNDRMQAMLQSMAKINEKSHGVSKVIKVIDEIAFQTNLLALNAAVEEARAGKYGKGFAVVAEEVRNLAGRSSVAAKDTTEMIQESIQEVETGVKNADQMAESLKSISDDMDQINGLVAGISTSSKEQRQGIEEINMGIGRVNDVVQQNAAIARESADAAETLAEQTAQLEEMIHAYRLTQKKTSVSAPAGKPGRPASYRPDTVGLQVAGSRTPPKRLDYTR